MFSNMGTKIYRKSFVFETNRFEEYRDGKCINKGYCKTTIIAKVLSNNVIGFSLQNDIPVNMNSNFGLPILGIAAGDILEDRVQYGRIPDTFRWNDPNEPLVCNIFNNLSCIRFAMMSPLRIVEFFGKFSDIRTF